MVHISFLPLALAATTAIASASARTNLYLSPAHNLAAPISSNKVGQVDVDQRAMVERLFDGHRDDEQNRLLVLMHGAAHNDLIPSGVHATHNIDAAPISSSFDALFDSYMSSLSHTLKSSESAISHLTGTFLDGFSASIQWLNSKSDAASRSGPNRQLRSDDDATQDLSLQPLRFSGLQDTRSEEQGRAASIAFVVTDATTLLLRISRSCQAIFFPRPVGSFKRASTAVRPTLKKPSHLPKNLAGTCFTSASDLERPPTTARTWQAVKTSKGASPATDASASLPRCARVRRSTGPVRLVRRRTSVQSLCFWLRV
ncbi:uncharacterized protein UTRI_02428 [Ustilago trichophora]|uniref:Uncharacterized protein n=1 Tax=Ustilago trichophora TaxID=86804 RepID=A0A5C3E6K6_9BASI|nr:uncharacterized protein UTRI_02428 [Ustilago trichophora]